jgi:cardiolipin synthase
MNLRWIPNAICLVRIALVPPVVISLLEQRYDIALLLFVIAGGSDGLDGFLAKRFGWQTRLGSLLDPIADKTLVSGTFITLGWLGLVPFGVVAVIVGRDVVIVLGAVAWQLFIAPVAGLPSLISKLNTACQLLFVVCAIAGVAWDWPSNDILTVLGAACIFTAIVSGLNYVLTWSAMAIGRADASGQPS